LKRNCAKKTRFTQGHKTHSNNKATKFYHFGAKTAILCLVFFNILFAHLCANFCACRGSYLLCFCFLPLLQKYLHMPIVEYVGPSILMLSFVYLILPKIVVHSRATSFVSIILFSSPLGLFQILGLWF